MRKGKRAKRKKITSNEGKLVEQKTTNRTYKQKKIYRLGVVNDIQIYR